MKKIFILASVIFVLTTTFWGVYHFVFQKRNNLKIDNVISTNSKKKEKIFSISDKKVIPDIIIDKSKDLIYFYSPYNQVIYESSFNGESVRVLDKLKNSKIVKLNWSPNGKKLIYQTANGDFYLKKINEDDEVKLKKGLDLVSWTNLGNKIIYKYYNNESQERSLNIANPDGSFWKRLSLLEWPKMKISFVPKSVLVSFWNYPQNSQETSLKIISLTGGEVKTIFSGFKGTDYLWSPDGKKFLVSSAEGKNKLRLGVVDSDGSNYQDLHLATLVSKCVWSKDNQNIYCALPLNIASSVTMPDDYQLEKIKTRDSFWKINIATGEKKRIVELEEIKGDYDVSSPLLSSDESYLFFINRFDSKLYAVEL